MSKKMLSRSQNKTKHATSTTLPSVNLLSPWVFASIANRRLRRRFIVASIVLAMLVAAAWGVQHLRAVDAEQRLGIELAESSRLTAQTQELAPIRVFVSAVEHQKVTVTETMSNELTLSGVLDALAVATPSGANVESLAVTLPASVPAGAEAVATVSPCPGPDPFNTRTVVGCITLSGTAADRGAVGDLVVNLGDSKLFVEPFISTTTTADAEGVTFTGSVGLSEKAFTKRYADLDALLKAEASR